MKSMILAIAVCGLLLGASDASAQNSSKCVSFKSGEGRWSSYSKTYEYPMRFTNNCNWRVMVSWRTNAFGKSLCGSFNSATWLDPGRTERTHAFQVRAALKIKWCADAFESSHPDHNTCPDGIKC